MNLTNGMKAVIIACGFFALLHFILTQAANFIVNNFENYQSWIQLMNLVAYVLYLISGFLAGKILNRHFTFIGLLAGLTSALIAVFMFGVGKDFFGIYSTLVNGAILGAIGGALSRLMKRQKANVL